MTSKDAIETLVEEEIRAKLSDVEITRMTDEERREDATKKFIERSLQAYLGISALLDSAKAQIKEQQDKVFDAYFKEKPTLEVLFALLSRSVQLPSPDGRLTKKWLGEQLKNLSCTDKRTAIAILLSARPDA